MRSSTIPLSQWLMNSSSSTARGMKSSQARSTHRAAAARLLQKGEDFARGPHLGPGPRFPVQAPDPARVRHFGHEPPDDDGTWRGLARHRRVAIRGRGS